MKQAIIVFVLLTLTFYCSAQSNVNSIHRMDKQGLRWTEDKYWRGTYHNDCNEYEDDILSYFTKGDTTAFEKQYVKVYQRKLYSEYYSCPNWYPPCGSCITYVVYNKPDTSLIGGLREDSTGKVYFIRFDSSLASNSYWVPMFFQPSINYEKLLYNFGAKKGDTLINDGTYRVYVVAIDSVIISDKTYRKHFVLNYNREITEGIGESSGLLGPWIYIFGNNSWWDFKSTLKCFADSGQYLMPYDTASGGHLPRGCDSSQYYGLGINEVKEPQQIKLFPNPTKGSVYVDFLTNAPGGSILQVYDITGSLLKTLSISKPNTEIDVSSYSNGVYVLKLTDKHGVTYVQRLIVNR